MKTARENMLRRAQRVRRRLKKYSNGRPRLSVFRSSKNIYVQIIDDATGTTLASASTIEDKKGRVLT